MAKKEKEQESKQSTQTRTSSTHTTATGRTAGGTGGSFGTAAKTQGTQPNLVKPIFSSVQPTLGISQNGAAKEGTPKRLVTAVYPALFDSSPADAIAKGETARAVVQAQRGLSSYISDYLQSHNEKQKREKLRLSSATADAPDIVHAFQNAVDSYRRDTSFREIRSDWSIQDKLKFGYLYDKDPKQAQRYAMGVNNDLDRAKTAQARSHIRSNATQDLPSGLLHTAGALGMSAFLPFGEAMDRAAQIAARGVTTEKSFLTPWDYVQEVKTGIRDALNSTTLDDDIPILGGKGWGDLYVMAFDVAESWLSANTIGRAYGTAGKMAAKAATRTNAFARSAVAALDAARRSGADGRQSAAFGLTMGLLDAAADSLPTENLLSISPATSVREFLAGALKHGALEGISDTLAEGLGQAAEYAILGDFSTFAQRRAFYQQQGFDQEEATRKALRDSMQDLGFTMLAGTAAGTVSAGAQYAAEGIYPNSGSRKRPCWPTIFHLTSLFSFAGICGIFPSLPIASPLRASSAGQICPSGMRSCKPRQTISAKPWQTETPTLPPSAMR